MTGAARRPAASSARRSPLPGCQTKVSEGGAEEGAHTSSIAHECHCTVAWVSERGRQARTRGGGSDSASRAGFITIGVADALHTAGFTESIHTASDSNQSHHSAIQLVALAKTWSQPTDSRFEPPLLT